LDETNNPTNEGIIFDSFKWGQVEMKENYGLVIPFI
jgi:hypothetical protein